MRTILISGGSEGLGKALAKQLAPKNKVIILARHKDKLEKTAQEIGCDWHICDVGEWEQVSKTVDQVLSKYGKIDVLINNAGLWIQDSLDQNDPNQIREVINANTLGTIYLAKAVIPNMKGLKSGWIINVISQAGTHAKAERTVYNASKWAITGFTRCLELELAPHGIKVSGIYPGQLRTSMFIKSGIKKSMDIAVDLEDVARTIEFILSFENTVNFPEIGIKHREG